MVRVIYCEMLGHDASFAYIPALQLASDPNLLTKKVRGICMAILSGCFTKLDANGFRK
jgi:AP-4 complex subunit epsilon-1